MHGVRRMETRHEDNWSPLVLVSSVLPAHCGGRLAWAPAWLLSTLRAPCSAVSRKGHPARAGEAQTSTTSTVTIISTISCNLTGGTWAMGHMSSIQTIDVLKNNAIIVTLC